MNKLIIVAALIAVVACEPPAPGGYSAPIGPSDISFSSGSSSGGSASEHVDDALLARIGQILTSGGDGSARGGQTNEASNLVDESVFARVAELLNQNGGGSSSGGAPSDSYGAPTRTSGKVQLGQPEPAERIAEFALEDNNQGGNNGNNGGYNNGPAQAPAPVARAPAPRGPVTLGQPEVAQRVADFAVQGGASNGNNGNRGSYTPPQARGRGGY